MKNKMLKFLTIEGEMPAKRDAKKRTQDFDEIYDAFAVETADAQSSRCSQCGVPFCQSGCPLENNIPDWLMLTAEGQLQSAYNTSAATNNMPEICGRICPQDRLCEGACVIEQSTHGHVTIGAVEKYLTDTAWENGWVEPLKPLADKSLSVGIVGAGPAGLAAAEMLRVQGWQVTVYDRHDRVGGLLVYGIPNFKLDKEVVERRATRLSDGGIVFKMNTDIGTDITFDELREKHDAVLMATGVYKARTLTVPGCGADGVIKALPYLMASNKRGLGDTVKAETAKGKNVVVIGGGDTAMDCVRTAIREGAKSVSCMYRRDEANMPGSVRETANAKDEGVKFEWQTNPKAVHDKNGKASAIKVARMRLGAKDASGRQSFSEIEGADFELKADLVIQALGFMPEDMEQHNADLKLTRWGTIKTHPTRFETSLEGVYAAGDIARGASLVVWAIREGRDAAAAMNQYLEAKLLAKEGETRRQKTSA